MVKFGVVGYGYWGPNVVRNLDRMDEAEVVAVCDKSASARRKVAKAYPDVRVTDDAAELMSSPEIDAIAVVTPVWTHYELAKAALEHGEHVFVEKPFTSNADQAQELIELAARKNLKIWSTTPSSLRVRCRRSSSYCMKVHSASCITTIQPG